MKNDGSAVALTPSVATTNTKFIVGTALTSGVSGDIITVAIDCAASTIGAA